jgi:hypothetical protein
LLGGKAMAAVCWLQALEGDPVRGTFVKRQQLCLTLAGNCCDVLTLTSPDSSKLRDRRGVVLTGEPRQR